MQITEKKVEGYERVVLGVDEAAGYHGIIAVHNTVLGPAVGGTRLWQYATEQEALTDALRLARGMTYKNSLAGLPLGGGKSVLMASDKITDRQKLFHAHGRLIASLNGTYITAEDVGTSPADMEFIREVTPHVGGLIGRSGDPSPVTARGVFRAMQATAQQLWKSDSLAGRTIALQGCGHVGYYLAKHLRDAGAKLLAADIDDSRLQRVVRECDAHAVPLADITASECDIFAPCALGAILNDQTIPKLDCKAVVGAANNQLLEPRHGDELHKRGILYAPDYAANAGGIINGCIELAGWSPEEIARRVDAIYGTLLKIYAISDREKVPTYRAADRLAEERLNPRSTAGK
jgi:leucine dehydrogenase